MRSKKISSLGLCAALAVLAHNAFASKTVVSAPGKTVVENMAHEGLLIACSPQRRDMHCTLPVGASRTQPSWLNIARAQIEQTDSVAVELSMTVRAAIPERPSVPVLIFYWQFQDGCTQPSPTNKDGINVFWNGREWTAHWFVIGGCDPRRVAIGDAVPFRFEGERVTVRVRLADLITIGGEPLRWFAGTRLLGFNHPIFTHTLPVDVAPDVVTIESAHPDTPLHPEPPASWTPQ